MPAATCVNPPCKDSQHELRKLANVGPATVGDLLCLGIHTIQALSEQDPDALFERLHAVTGTNHDPCVADVFHAAVHEARTGERLKWWHFSKLRKEKAATGIRSVAGPAASGVESRDRVRVAKRQRRGRAAGPCLASSCGENTCNLACVEPIRVAAV